MKSKPPPPVFTLPRGSEWPTPYAYRMPEPTVTREAVVEAYRHPLALVRFRLARPSRDPIPAAAQRLVARAELDGFNVAMAYAFGTSVPTWRVNAPDSKPNPGPPVHASQYHGDLVETVQVTGRHPERGHFVAYWTDGKSDGVLIWAPGGMLLPSGITHLMRKLDGSASLSIHPDE